MRTTLAIDDDVLLAAKAIASRQRRSVGAVISELARKSLSDRPARLTRNGIPLLPRSKDSSVVVTLELVKRASRRRGVTYLLDVNVIVALIDSRHVFHDLAHDRFAREGQAGWATCPATENGAVRILGHPRYPEGPGRPAGAAVLVSGLRSHPNHQFWSDDISLFSRAGVRLDAIATAAQVTDTYLLALARARGRKLATLDRRLSPAAVHDGAAAFASIG